MSTNEKAASFTAEARLGRHEDGRRMVLDCKPCLTLAGRVRHYRCPGCELAIPWCNGADDELGELCDDCAADVLRARAS